jgi:hypothetical protein
VSGTTDDDENNEASDTVFSIRAEMPEGLAPDDEPGVAQEQLRLLQQRRAMMEKVRAAKGKAQPVPPKKQATAGFHRKAEVRTAEDAAYAGLGSNPGPAEPARASRESVQEEVRTRVRRDERDTGWADLPRHRRKPNWDYEYKTIRVFNEPVDPGDMMEVRNALAGRKSRRLAGIVRAGHVARRRDRAARPAAVWTAHAFDR